jgi:hypothetical protein
MARKRKAPAPPRPPSEQTPESVPHGPLTAPRPTPAPEPGASAAQGRRIRLITTVPNDPERSVHGRVLSPFAKPAQSGTYSPWAAVQARRGR